MQHQHVHVEGGQAIVGNVSTPAPGGGATKKMKEQPDALGYAPGVQMPRHVEAEREAMHGAGGGAPRGNRNAWKHGKFAAETLTLTKQISTLVRMASETMGASERS